MPEENKRRLAIWIFWSIYSSDHPPTFPKLIELRDDLSELFAIKVDVVTRNSLKARIRERVLAEVIYL
jgi:predicted nucleotidyltransferase